MLAIDKTIKSSIKRAHFNRIAIIQSIPDGELHTGTKLYEDVDMLNVAYDRGLEVKLYNIKTKDEYMNLLSSLTDEARTSGLLPILHIEAHGSSDTKGIVLSSGDFISWEEMKKPLIGLNIETKNNLLIVLAVCYGAYLTEILLPTDRAPCWGLVGPAKQIPAYVVLKSFIVFYTELLSSVLSLTLLYIFFITIPHLMRNQVLVFSGFLLSQE